MHNDSCDYSHVDSRAKAEALALEGKLVRMLLFPIEFGGEDIEENAVYVPEFVQEIKSSSDSNVVANLVEQGLVTRYIVTPRYQGKSVVPCVIDVQALDPGNFGQTICIWGEGLNHPLNGDA